MESSSLWRPAQAKERRTIQPKLEEEDLLNFMVTAFDEGGTLVASQIARTKADFNPEAMKDVVAGGVRMHQEIEMP